MEHITMSNATDLQTNEYLNNYGCRTFSGDVMLKYLQPDVYDSLLETMGKAKPLDSAIANSVAHGMMEWAIDNGCTHYTHWFQPLTGTTAEKHDAFLEPTEKGAIAEFAGDLLIRGEPDASSFPSGGIRDTWEARGYTAWDATSPAFIMPNDEGGTLCIPTAFVSWTGEALDKKTPLLRSIDVVNEQAMRILNLFSADPEVSRVITTLGLEQEYFLVDESYVAHREDLLLCGRTLIGTPPPKGHQLDDHYFGKIPERVLSFMDDAEQQLYELGIPVKTRHNEVAPGQYEIAPSYENANVASDHQMLLMSVLKTTAEAHGFACLLHEKPFAGVNGSGKHNNWSIATDTGKNLLSPGKDPYNNMPFLLFLCAVIRAVDLHADILRASIASAANDHRLGANEAPPAIMSIYLGKMLSGILDQIESDSPNEAYKEGTLNLGAETMPCVDKHSDDRNRTSPFAFTGNKFEFRAVGSTSTIAWPNTILNTIIAESLDYFATSLESTLAGSESEEQKDSAARALLRDVLSKHRKVVFNGDNYSSEWHKEAERRGLPNLKTAVDAFPSLKTERALDLFERYNVLSNRELTARSEVLLENYYKIVQIEARTLLMMLSTKVLPAALRYQGELASIVQSSHAVSVDCSRTSAKLGDLARMTENLQNSMEKIQGMLLIAHENNHDNARFVCDKILPEMSLVRQISDQIEESIPSDIWPLPTYTEMLFIR